MHIQIYTQKKSVVSQCTASLQLSVLSLPTAPSITKTVGCSWKRKSKDQLLDLNPGFLRKNPVYSTHRVNPLFYYYFHFLLVGFLLSLFMVSSLHIFLFPAKPSLLIENVLPSNWTRKLNENFVKPNSQCWC